MPAKVENWGFAGRRSAFLLAAFTLVELLVVVAIIALLMTILVPNLSKAKVLTKRAACLANLSNLGKAAAIYQAEFGDYVPICWTNIDPKDHSQPNAWKSWRTSLLPYTTGCNAFNCPAVTDSGVGGELFHTAEEIRGYQMCGTVNEGSYGILYQYSLDTYKAINSAGVKTRGHPIWSQAFPVAPGVAWRHPADSVYVADGVLADGAIRYPSQTGYKGYGTSAIVPPSDPAYSNGQLTRRFADRHEGTNCLFVDGHAGIYETRALDHMVAGNNDCIWDTE